MSAPRLRSGSGTPDAFTVTGADWESASPLDDRALAAYAEHGCLLLRSFAPAAAMAASSSPAVNAAVTSSWLS